MSIHSIVQAIENIECGCPDEETYLESFQFLLDNNVIHHLQGSYQRAAFALIEQGLLQRPGD